MTLNITSCKVEKITPASSAATFHCLELRNREYMASLFAEPRFACLKIVHFRVFYFLGDGNSDGSTLEALCTPGNAELYLLGPSAEVRIVSGDLSRIRVRY